MRAMTTTMTMITVIYSEDDGDDDDDKMMMTMPDYATADGDGDYGDASDRNDDAS